MSALEGVEAFVPLWFDLFVSDVAGAYWRRLDPRWVVVSAVRCAELSVWFAFSASASAPRRRQRVGWEGLVVYTDSYVVPNLGLGGDRGQCPSQTCGLRTMIKRHAYAIISGFSLVVNTPSALELASALVRALEKNAIRPGQGGANLMV